MCQHLAKGGSLVVDEGFEDGFRRDGACTPTCLAFECTQMFGSTCAKTAVNGDITICRRVL